MGTPLAKLEADSGQAVYLRKPSCLSPTSPTKVVTVNVRRLVTGHDASGRSVFVSDEEVESVTFDMLPGFAIHKLWGGDAAPTFPGAGRQEDWTSYFPAVGGFRFVLATFPPEPAQPPADVDFAAAVAEFEQKLPGLITHMEPDEPGMHTSDTIDFEVLLSGQLTLELDDGQERLLQPGDAVVQNGTRHRWKNAGTEPAVMAGFIVGAHRAQSAS